MESIITYINKYGNYSFEEKSIGEIDYAILTVLSYLNFDDILYEDRTKVKLNDAVKTFFDKYDEKILKTHGFGLRDAYAIIKELIDKKRYKDLELYNYIYITDENIQFSAMFIDISKDKTFISIEGTDDEISGWKEDFQLSYKFPVPAHKECIKYLNRNIPLLTDRRYIISGHSKGGNLALVGAMYMSLLKQHKVSEIYSFDGPGLREEEFKSFRYTSLKNKYHKIIPNYSVVGLLLNNKETYTIVDSSKKGILAHSIYNWKVNDDKFLVVDSLSPFSIRLDETITNWLNNYDYKTRKELVDDLFSIFERCNIDNLYKIYAKDLKEITSIIKETKRLSPETKEIIKELIHEYVHNIKEDTFSFIKSKQD